MKDIKITEELVKDILNKVLIEESARVRREEYNRIRFKTEDLNNSLSDSIRELEKLKLSIPDGLNGVTKGIVLKIQSNLNESKILLTRLNNKIRQHKKSVYVQQVEETKK